MDKKNNKGLLDLSILENAGNDDVLDLPLNEDVNVPVPGGLSEKAPGQPADQSIPIPSKTTITADTYNEAIGNLKKTFKEAAELMEVLENAVIVQKTPEQLQEEFTEAAIDEAMFESFSEGPIFEAVDKKNKKEIKAIAKSIRKTLCKHKREVNWRKGNGTSGERLGFFDPFVFARAGKDISLISWQMVCILHPEKRLAMKHVSEDLNKEFSGELKGHKLRILKARLHWFGGPDVKELDKDDKKKSADSKKSLGNEMIMYVLIVDDPDDPTTTKELSIDVDAKMGQKLQSMIAPNRSMNEFVEYLEEASKDCDGEDCGEPEKDESKEDKKED